MRGKLLRWAYRLYNLPGLVTKPVVFGVRILLVQDETVLLVRHTYQDHWFFPGGAVKPYETMMEAAVREAGEEAGAVPLAEPRLLGLYSWFHPVKSDHIAVFICDRYRLGQATDRWEIAERAVFPLNALPSKLWPGSERRIAEFREGRTPYVRIW